MKTDSGRCRDGLPTPRLGPRRPTQSGPQFPLLIAAIVGGLWALFGGGGNPLMKDLDAMEGAIKKEVKDDSRRKQALDVLKQSRDELKESQGREKELMKPLVAALNQRTSTASDIRAAWEPAETLGKESARRQVALRMQLRKVLTAQEWSVVFPPPASPAEGPSEPGQEVHAD